MGELVGVFLLVLALLLVGSFWWLTGVPIVGEPERGRRRAAVIAGRIAILAAVWWCAYQPGWVGNAGTVGLVLVAFAGGVGWARKR